MSAILAAHAISGNRVRIQDSANGGSSCSRGWHILRSQWRDFLVKRGDLADQVLTDMEVPRPAERPTSLNLSKDGFDRMLDKILTHYTSDSPRTKAKASVWHNASQSNTELRALLGDPWLHRREDGERVQEGPSVVDPAMSFFPTDWSNCCTEETLAELIIDAYSSNFVDAFLDGAVSLVEVSNKWTAVQTGSFNTLQQSTSEGSLTQPKANLRLRNTSTTDKVLLQMGLCEPSSTSTDGFTMNGLSKDNWEAWNSRNFHKCKPLDPFVKRIQKATESQRPQRRLVKNMSTPQVFEGTTRPTQSQRHDRKYVWPMHATNFPSHWERSSYRPRTMAQQADFNEDDDDLPADKWLMRVGKDGKTTFPYSLVSHRAFIEAQPDPILKEKARKIAPLQLSAYGRLSDFPSPT